MRIEHKLKVYYRKGVVKITLIDSTCGGGTTPAMWIRRVHDEGGMFCFEDGSSLANSFVPWNQITYIAIDSWSVEDGQGKS